MSNSATNKAAGIRTARVGTIIWGLLALTVGGLVLAAEVGGVYIEPGIVLIGLLIGTGLALVIGGALSMTRKNK